MNRQSIHQFKVKDINGNKFDFAELKGKKIIVVNTASECGLTPQYENLQEVYETFKDDNLVIVGFPSNDFGTQEPGSDKEIAIFCSRNYGVTFPMMSKISVKGIHQHDIYKFLTHKEINGLKDSEIEWNFQKYLIDENGFVVRVMHPNNLVIEESVIDWITGKN